MRLSTGRPAAPGTRRARVAPTTAGGLAVAVGLALALTTGLVPAAAADTTTATTATTASTAATSTTSSRTALHRRLNALGCQAGPAKARNARRDLQLRAALVRVQSRHGVPQSGRHDAATRVLLAGDPLRCDRRPVPARSGEGRRIVVSQGQHWVWLVDGEGRVVGQGPMIDDERKLRPGTYATGSYCGRAARIERNRDLTGRYHLDHFVRFASCGFGFHGIPRRVSSGKPIHAEWLLGTDLDRSQGCFRLSRSLREQVWRFTGAGRTPVRVLG